MEFFSSVGSKKCFIGFDGFIDTICRVVRHKSYEVEEAYKSLSEWSQAIDQASGKSANFELSLIDRRLGGNACLLSKALITLEHQVFLAATLGKPGSDPNLSHGEQVDEVFISLTECCSSFFNLGSAGQTHALEFNDGKLLLGLQGQLPHLNHQDLEKKLGEKWIDEWLVPMDFIALVNWTMCLNMGHIIDSINRYILQHPKAFAHRPYLLLDPADPKKREATDLKLDLMNLHRLSDHFKLILCVNYSEAEQIARAFNPLIQIDKGQEKKSLAFLLEEISQKLPSFVIIIHDLYNSAIKDQLQSHFISNPWIEKPLITTGGGDHFNAGVAHALMSGFSLEDTIRFASIVAASYVQNGICPTIEQVNVFRNSQEL
jgi:hydroxymethylpyrimidine/phosphomethylpyrimidine kinase